MKGVRRKGQSIYEARIVKCAARTANVPGQV